MKVGIIQNEAQLEALEPFYVDKLLWGTKSVPKTYGYIGFVPGDGFCLKMVCEEKDPLRRYSKDMEPVYRDSAMEAFFLFESRRGNLGSLPYINLEANANGALLAAYGQERLYRSYFSRKEYRQFKCRAEIREDDWTFSIKLPIRVLERVYGPLDLGEGSSFTCNFYKISETKEIEHYASYARIESEVPSFHLPEFFERAVITRGSA